VSKPIINKISLRGNYINYRLIKYAIDTKLNGKQIEELDGYVPPILEFEFEKSTVPIILSLEFEDIHYITQTNQKDVHKYIYLLNDANNGNKNAEEQLLDKRISYLREKEEYFKKNGFTENEFVVPSCTSKHYDLQDISHKGESLLELSQKGYPVPDFSILTAKAFLLSNSEMRKYVKENIHNLEKLTNEKLGSDKTPLVFAMRCAMSKYIPGLMPTYLNVGVTQNTFIALKDLYGYHVASKIYLNNLQNIYQLLYPDTPEPKFVEKLSRYSFRDVYSLIQFYYDEILKKDEQLLLDPYYQVFFFINEVHKFYSNNKQLLHSLFVKDKSYPSLILQKMVWTIRDNESYPGVLYSRHSRTGLGHQIESFPAIFGEDIMTGDIDTIDTEFFSPEEIKDTFPAIYHFYPKLSNLEKILEGAATIEFAAESFGGNHFFALLQLNNSEMTGRATLLSAIDMYEKKCITRQRVLNLVHPYHLRQIFSDSINDESFGRLKYFSSGMSVLPRLAVSCKIYFSADKAIEANKRGESVCLCKKQFVPADTIVMGEVNAIISLNPAAIHVVTACLSYGVPAFLNLEDYNVDIKGDSIVNEQGLVINEGEWITISSKNKKIYFGKADFIPARFKRFLNGDNLKLNEKEEKVFLNMKKAYAVYSQITDGLNIEDISDLEDLMKIIQTDLKNEPAKASMFMNSWFDLHKNYYSEQVLKSGLGVHKNHHNLFNMLSTERRIAFFSKSISICFEKGYSGYSAGSFMLGRFLSLQQTCHFWKSFSNNEIAFMLNEVVLFEKYIYILNEVGERRLNKAKELILDRGLSKIILNLNNAKELVTLKLNRPAWHRISEIIEEKYDNQTLLLCNILTKPYSTFYDYDKPWSINKLKQLCVDEGIGLPNADEA